MRIKDYEPKCPFTKDDLETAYARLPNQEKNVIDYMVTSLEKGMHMRGVKNRPREKTMFGPGSALELLAAIGRLTIRLEDGEVNICTPEGAQ